MRLFTAIDIPDDVVERVESTASKLRPFAQIKWSPIANLHITTKFIGEWPDERIPELNDALVQLDRRDPISVTVHGFGFYPNKKSPNIFCTGVEASSALTTLAKDTDHAASQLGIPAEARPYSPHLTLARIKNPADLSALLQQLEKLGQPDFGTYEVDRFHLYLSKPGPGGSVYTKLSEFPFTSK